MVGPSTCNPWTSPQRLHTFPCFLQLPEMRQQKTLTLTRALQASIEESGFPTGVLSDAAWELQWCMAPLLFLNGDEIVEASLLRPIEGEHGTSPMPEEEAAFLGDIKPDIKPNIKPDIKPPQVPEQLEIHEQVQPTEQTATPTAPIPSPPSQPSPLPSQKVKNPWERATKADTTSAALWVWAYIEENYRVPKWWREFQSLLKCPCDSAIQLLAHQQAAAFQIPATQLEKDGWWIVPPCLEVLEWRKYLPPQDFQRSHDYQKVRKEETVTLAVAIQNCTVQSGTPQECYVEQCRSSANVLPPSLRMMVSWPWRCYMLWKRTTYLLLLLPYSRSWGGRIGHTNTWGVLHFWARGGCPFGGRIRPCTGQISHKTTRFYPLTGESNPCRFSEGITPRSTARPLLSGVTSGIHTHGPMAGEVHYKYQSCVITQVSLQLPLFEPFKPSDSPPRIQELWGNTTLFLLLMSDFTAP